MTKQYREWHPHQPYLFPPSPHDWLDEGDLAYFILDVVDALDLSAIEAAIHAKDARGNRPYHPRMMTALLLYGYCVGVMSSRKIDKATYRDVAFRVIAGGCHPHHTRISEFRRQHLSALQGLFVQTVLAAQNMGLVKLGRVGLDGTKMKANASKHKAMSYERMLKAQAELREEIEQLLLLAEQTDQEEDARYGRGKRGDEVPEELRRRESRLSTIQATMAELEAEAAKSRADELRERAEQQRKKSETADDPAERKRAATRAAKAQAQANALTSDDEDDPPSAPGSPADDLPHHRVPTTPEGKPKPEAQRNFTDADSRIMKRDGTYLQGYNGQAAVDGEHLIIVSCAATNQPPDQQHLPPLVEQIRENLGAYPDKLLADAGYWDKDHVGFCEERNIDPYIATGRLKRGELPPPIRGRPPKDLDAKGRMYRKLRTKRGREEYARRKVIPEPVFGQIRVGQGFQHFLLRGIDKVQAEWSLVCACHNLLKIFRAAGAISA
jgi:transposase